MNRPDNISVYDEIDLKLGIKSSLPNVKSTLALLILFWESCKEPSDLVYSKKSGDKIVLEDALEQEIINYLSDIISSEELDLDALKNKINENQLFKSQLEALIVALELVWKLAKISFVDESLPASQERTGGIRYHKKIEFSVNMDLIGSLFYGQEARYKKVLLNWLGVGVAFDPECAKQIERILTVLSEGAIFKLQNNTQEVIFNQNSIYQKIIKTKEPIDISGDLEAKGSLRILKSSLAEGVNPYLSYVNSGIVNSNVPLDVFSKYQKRVETLHKLSATKVVGINAIDAKEPGYSQFEFERNRIPGGKNTLLYGVPGSGKSYAIAHEYAEDDAHTERVVFHPDYSYSDFVGQILPKVEQHGDGTSDVSYEFAPGPFTKIMRNAFWDPDHRYVLIIEELNRGNAPAIFGEIFQLLDRKLEIKKKDDDGFKVGTSEYGVTNKDVAFNVYGDEGVKIRIPSNLDIVATMNTSDQNVFSLDTAFQRRWHMVQIENSFDNVDEKFAEAEILDTTITWKAFCETINKVILTSKSAMATSEDKRLGVFFITLDDIRYSDDGVKDEEEFIRLRKKERHDELNDAEKERLRNIRIARNHNRIFPEKVLKYLWDDAFKFNPEMVFDKANYDSLESVIKAFTTRKEKERFVVLSKQVRESLGITLSE